MLPANHEHIFPAGHAQAGIYLPNTAGPAIVESLDVLRAIADCVPAGGRLLELGTWSGAGAAWIADQRPDAEIVSVDNFAFCPQNLLLWQCNQRPNMRLYVGQTIEFGLLSRASFHVVLVDADHERPGIDTDLCVASDLIETEGVVAVHDYGCRAWPGVKAAVDEFCAQHGWRIAHQVATLVVLRQYDRLAQMPVCLHRPAAHGIDLAAFLALSAGPLRNALGWWRAALVGGPG